MMSVEVDMVANKILDADADFYLASKGYKISNLHNSTRHSGKIKGVEYNPFYGGNQYKGTMRTNKCNAYY